MDPIVIITAAHAVLVPVIVGVVEVFKRVGLTDRFAPLAALILGVAGAWVFVGGTVASIAIGGIAVGLLASGLYSGGRTTLNV